MELYVGVVIVYLLLYAGVFVSDIVTVILCSSRCRFIYSSSWFFNLKV